MSKLFKILLGVFLVLAAINFISALPGLINRPECPKGTIWIGGNCRFVRGTTTPHPIKQS
jgi:hypothetical protein